MVLKLPAICFALLLPPLAFGCSELASTVGQPGTSARRSPTTNHSQLATHDSLLTPSTKTIDLGIVPQGGREQEAFALVNPGTDPVEITKFETSCECLEIDLLRRDIGPSERVLARAILDLGKEPQFVGHLGIEVNGLTRDGKTAFSIVVDVSVRPPDEFEGSVIH